MGEIRRSREEMKAMIAKIDADLAANKNLHANEVCSKYGVNSGSYYQAKKRMKDAEYKRKKYHADKTKHPGQIPGQGDLFPVPAKNNKAPANIPPELKQTQTFITPMDAPKISSNLLGDDNIMVIIGSKRNVAEMLRGVL